MIKILPYEIQLDLESFSLMIPRLVFDSSSGYTTTKISNSEAKYIWDNPGT